MEAARIESRQMPIFVRDLRSLAAEIGLDWQRARGLWSAGILSFDPDAVVAGDESCQAEFRFLGHLAGLGLPDDAVALLLRGLRKPYAYDLGRIYFDWPARCWRLRPDGEDPEALFFAMLARLESGRESRVLLEIRELAESALDLARGRTTLFGHEGARRPGAPARPTDSRGP
ncbi:MAG: hypothetical protein IAE82_16270 [Opitutaceae bacterium]|nr:hypothetical protein [Opitutaceae bacterium]